jgi:hypothetical protein
VSGEGALGLRMCRKGQVLKVGSFWSLAICQDTAVNSGFYCCTASSKVTHFPVHVSECCSYTG